MTSGPESKRRVGRFSVGLPALGVSLALLSAASPSWASREDDAIAEAQRSLNEARVGANSVQQSVANTRVDERSAEARIADGELLLGGKDYGRASHVFNQVIEKYPNHPTAFADATFLLGQTYYDWKQYLSARRVFRQIVERPDDQRFATYQPRALARLVDVALHIQDYSTLDEVFSRMNRIPASGAVEGELNYARGKGLFAKRDMPGARGSLSAVPAQSPHYHQARYLLAVLTMKEAPVAAAERKGKGELVTGASKTRFAAAIEAFRQVTQLPGDTEEHRHVIDLAWLAIGRLFYETDQLNDAASAYNHVDRTSSEFSNMLYELAWVYVRVGDADRAQRALEVLAVADPNSSYTADGTLLRGDLMLRAGQFDKALSLYQATRAQFDPMREKVQAFLDSTSDPAVYYDKLSKEEGFETSDKSGSLPPLAIRWAREAEDGPAAFAVMDSVSQSRDLIKQSNVLVERLSLLLNAPNRVRAFPEIKVGEERAMALLNTVTMARRSLAKGLDATEEDVNGELSRVRDERRMLEKRLQFLPVNDSDFSDRENQAQKQWNEVSQKLQQLTLQVDQLQAIVNGLRRTLQEGSQRGVLRDPSSSRQFEAELLQNERDLAVYKAQMSELRKMLEAGRTQVGFGDQRFVEDAQVRAAYRRAMSQEARLASDGAGGRNAVGYAQRVVTILSQADETDGRLESVLADLESRVGKRATELQAVIDSESGKLAQYGGTLDGFDSEARLVVGQVAMRNIELVRDRLKNIVLRADVGVTEQAWEVREEEQTRVRNLQLERGRSEQQLNDELREVLDDMGETEKPSSGDKK